MSGPCLLGVDGGNNKTVALVTDLDGAVLGRGAAGNGDIYGAPDEASAVRAVLDAVRSALGKAAVPAGDVRAAAFYLAGVDWPEDQVFWSAVTAAELPGARVSIGNDALALLGCLGPAATGAAVGVGTGPAIAARGGGGTEACLGFWCQDPLGGYGLGELALRAVYLSEAGLAPPSRLREALLRHFGYDDVEDLLHDFTRRGRAKPQVEMSGAARIVLAEAVAGDPTCLALVEEQATRLAGYAESVTRRAGLASDPAGPRGDAWPVALGGGVVTSDLPIFRDSLTRALARRLPAARPVLVAQQPVFGAVVGAAALLDLATASNVHRALGLPGPESWGADR